MAASSLQDLNKMKVIDLKKELKMRGLDTVGKRNELIERLNASLDSTGNEIDLSTESEDYMNDVLNVSEELDFEFEEDENVFENEENTSIARTVDPKIPRANERKLSESSDDVNNSENNPESTTEETSTKQENEAVTAVGTAECKRVIKLSNISAKERLEMRAKKFGTILIADQKKEARFVTFGGQVDTNIEKLKKRAERFGTSVSPIMPSLDKISITNPNNKLSTKGRLGMRAKKFGTILIADQKKEAGFARFGGQVEILRKRAERFGTSVSPIMPSLDKISITNPNNKLSTKGRLGMRVKKFGTTLTAYQENEAGFARFGGQVEILRKRAERFGTSVSPILSALDQLEKRKVRFEEVDGPAKKDPFV